MNLNNVRIGTRLAIGFGAVLLLLLVIVGIAWTQLHRTNGGLAELATLEQRAGIARDWVSKTQINVSRSVAIAKANGQPDIEKYFGPLIKATSAEISTLQKSMETLVAADAGSKELLAKVASQRAAYVALRGQLLELVKQADAPAAEALLTNKMLPASEAYLSAMAAVQERQIELAKSEADRLSAGISTSSKALLILLLLSAAVGATMAFFITRSVTAPLQEGVKTAALIAAGDLSQTLNSTRRDEIGDLLRALGQMQNALHQLVGQVRSSTDSISTASAEIATGNQDLSMRTEQTASNLQQAAASMEQLTGTVAQSADSARQANRLAAGAAEVAGRGGVVVSQVVATMDEINASSKQISDIVGEITTAATEQSNDIGQMHQSVSQLDQMTQQNAALVEQSAAAAESLQGQTVKLASLVAVFKLGSGRLAHA